MTARRWMRLFLLVLILLPMLGTSGAMPASAQKDSVLEAAQALLDDTYSAYTTLPQSIRFARVLDTDSTYRYISYVASNIDHMRVHDQAWKDYKYALTDTSVTVSGETARVYTTVNLDYHYQYAPKIDSSIYHMRFSFGLALSEGKWQVSSVDIGGLNCFSAFRDKEDARKNKGVPYREIVQDVVQLRYTQTRELKRQLEGMARSSQKATRGMENAAVAYDRGKAVEYALLYARRGPGERLFATITDGNCQVYVSGAIWAGYGGWNGESGGIARIQQRYRMTDAWYGVVKGVPSKAFRSAEEMWRYMVTEHAYGPQAVGLNDKKTFDRLTVRLEMGDVIQLYRYKLNQYGYSLMVSVPTSDPYMANAAHVMVCGNTGDTVNRSLVDFLFAYDGLYGEAARARLISPQAAVFEE